MQNEQLVQQRMKDWTNNTYFDAECRHELRNISDPEEIEDRFYKELEFGTGGMRGTMGAGTNRMNRYTVRKTSQGLADIIKLHGAQACARGVVIAYDSRRLSPEFALETALIMAANGIRAYLFASLSPTPELSYAVRYLKAIAGVNITASHNPREYNGYKVYWDDGGQLPPEAAKQIVDKMSERKNWEIHPLEEYKARAAGLLHTIGEEIDQAYEGEILRTMLNPVLTKESGRLLKIVFTPLHGCGGKAVPFILEKSGFSNCWVVPEQALPDPEFPTVQSPNPEDPVALAMAVRTAMEHDADLILATDPDADRLGALSRDRTGELRRFTGNQIGVILFYYILSMKKRLGILPQNGVLVKTVASTDLADAIARDFGIRTVNVLVGFKYIGEQIKEMEEKAWGSFLFGFEESHGYLAGTYTRDKDGVQAAAMLAEAALYYQLMEGKVLSEVLAEIYAKYGTFLDEQVAFTLHGKEGRSKIERIMERLRSVEYQNLSWRPLDKIEDYRSSSCLWPETGKTQDICLPCENILRVSFAGGGFVMVRPSGTEPKIRFYFCIKGNSLTEAQQIMTLVKDGVLSLIRDLL